MTTDELAVGYLRKCRDRMAALDVLRSREAFSDVVREGQEIVELALKGILRSVGVDPPKIHDVGDLLIDYADRLPMLSEQERRDLALASKELRKEREFSFHGDIDYIPTAEYDTEDSDRAHSQADAAVSALDRVLAAIRPR